VPNLRVQIVRFVAQDPQPGIVEAEFTDVKSNLHRIIEKIPIMTDADLWSDSIYPQPGFIACKVQERIENPDGPGHIRITIAEPWGVETVSGESEFVVSEADLTN